MYAIYRSRGQCEVYRPMRAADIFADAWSTAPPPTISRPLQPTQIPCRRIVPLRLVLCWPVPNGCTLRPSRGAVVDETGSEDSLRVSMDGSVLRSYSEGGGSRLLLCFCQEPIVLAGHITITVKRPALLCGYKTMHMGHDPDAQVLAFFYLSRPLKVPLVVVARHACMTVSYISLFRCLRRRFKPFAPVLDTDAMLHDDGSSFQVLSTPSLSESPRGNAQNELARFRLRMRVQACPAWSLLRVIRGYLCFAPA